MVGSDDYKKATKAQKQKLVLQKVFDLAEEHKIDLSKLKTWKNKCDDLGSFERFDRLIRLADQAGVETKDLNRVQDAVKRFTKEGLLELGDDGAIKYGKKLKKLGGRFAQIAGKASPILTAITVAMFLNNPAKAIGDEIGWSEETVSRFLNGEGQLRLDPSFFGRTVSEATLRLGPTIRTGDVLFFHGPDGEITESAKIKKIVTTHVDGVVDVTCDNGTLMTGVSHIRQVDPGALRRWESRK